MKIFARNEIIEVAEMGDELGMLNLENGMYYVLDSIGTRVWSYLDSPQNINQIVDKLLLEYDVINEECNEDISNLLNSMLEKCIIKEV